MQHIIITAYRFFGMVGASFTFFQSIIWLCLSVLGATCTFIGCGSEGSKETFKYCFYLYYFKKTEKSTARMNYIAPTYFLVIMSVSAVMCIVNMIISFITAKAFIRWKRPRTIQKYAGIWTKCIFVISVLELIMFIIFFIDVMAINQKEDAKCFLGKDLALSSDTMSNGTAPYLLKLKSNLKIMQKKIKKLKRNLILLDVILDEGSRKHEDNNPFISKKNVNSYVKDIWEGMFNNNIRKKVRRKTGKLPFDEELKKFIVDENLLLDDSDYELLMNFDGLTNRKWIKPTENSSVAFGKDYNLSTSITEDNSTKLMKIATLLHEYIKESEMQNKIDYAITDKIFDIVLRTILNEFEEEDTGPDDLNKIMLLNENNNVSLNLRKYLEEKRRDNDEGKPKLRKDNEKEDDRDAATNKATIETASKKTTESSSTTQSSSKPTKSSSTSKSSSTTTKSSSTSQASKKTTKSSSNSQSSGGGGSNENDDYIKDLCQNCLYFVLSPSIFCMIMSLKTGLVWIINIVMAIMLCNYGGKITVKHKPKIPKIWPIQK